MADTIAGLETELNSDSLTEEERTAMNERLEAKKAQYAKVTDPAGMYDISPEDIEIYKQYGDRLYFQAPAFLILIRRMVKKFAGWKNSMPLVRLPRINS